MDQNKVLVLGHKNPDTDSICSSISYAYLKRAITGTDLYEAGRVGEINQETEFVLKYFGVEKPELVEDVRPQVKDIEIRRISGIDATLSLKEAWKMMRENGVVTLPIVTKGKHLSGVITVNDITKLNMDVYDNEIIARAKTPYSNIIETLEGEMIVGDPDAVFDRGKVLIAAANPDMMENYIEQDDMVILGNRYESQLCAIEMNAQCLVVCLGANVSMTIRKLAQEKHCSIIVTEFDTLTAARIISQSIPVRYGMTSQNLLTFSTDDYVDDIRDTMAKVRHRDFPVLDGRHFAGMISRRNLLGMKKKQVILVDHNERNQAVSGIGSAEILEIIDHHRLGTIETMAPVFFRNQPLGCTATIIYQMFLEQGVPIPTTIAGLLCSALISDTLLFRSPTCTEVDRAAAEELAKIAGLDMENFAREMFAAGSNLKAKEPEAILNQDLKMFHVSNYDIAVAQINSMNVEEFEEIQERMLPFIEAYLLKEGVDMVFFMMTSILDENSRLIYVGEQAEAVVMNGFDLTKEQLKLDGDYPICLLEGVVSRKKQLLPAILRGIEAIEI